VEQTIGVDLFVGGEGAAAGGGR
jgi:hypothetical protein